MGNKNGVLIVQECELCEGYCPDCLHFKEAIEQGEKIEFFSRCVYPPKEERLEKIELLEKQNTDIVKQMSTLIKQLEINRIDIRFQLKYIREDSQS